MNYKFISLFDLAKLVNKAVRYEHKDIPDSMSMLHHLIMDDGKAVIAFTAGSSVVVIENSLTSESFPFPRSESKSIAV
jgi:hypothetical protein